MRARIGALLFTVAVFAVASRATAASVDIAVLQQAPGSTSWNLQVTSFAGVGVAAISLVVSDSLSSFTPAPAFAGPPPICVTLHGVCSLAPVAPGFDLLNLSFSPSLPSGAPLLLGTFTSAASDALVQVLPADDVEGGTVFDALGAAIPDYSIRVVPAVPEPTAAALLLLAALGGLARRARL
jgi:hypothetical protein